MNVDTQQLVSEPDEALTGKLWHKDLKSEASV
jgi:hypothetical protein